MKTKTMYIVIGVSITLIAIIGALTLIFSLIKGI